MGQAISKSVAVAEILKVVFFFCFLGRFPLLICLYIYMAIHGLSWQISKIEKDPWFASRHGHQFS
jgi:hypothetical protein